MSFFNYDSTATSYEDIIKLCAFLLKKTFNCHYNTSTELPRACYSHLAFIGVETLWRQHVRCLGRPVPRYNRLRKQNRLVLGQ